MSQSIRQLNEELAEELLWGKKPRNVSPLSGTPVPISPSFIKTNALQLRQLACSAIDDYFLHLTTNNLLGKLSFNELFSNCFQLFRVGEYVLDEFEGMEAVRRAIIHKYVGEKIKEWIDNGKKGE